MKRPLGIALLAASVLTIAACSDDKSASDGTTAASAPAPDASAPAGDGSAYCDTVREYNTSSSALDQAFSSGDAAALETELGKLKPVIETLQSQAPAEIQSDVQTMAAGLLDMIAIFDQYDYDLAKVSASPEFQELNTRMNSQEVATAGDNLNTYESEVCGITES